MPRRPALALSLCALGACLAARPAAAHTVPAPQVLRVLIVSNMTVADLHHLEPRGAVGLLVPGVGPTTNRRRALAALVRGVVENARLGGVPAGRVLISTDAATGIPSGRDEIILSLPPKGGLVRNDRRYPIAVVGRGFHGILVSPTTRIPGLVSVLDVAPTALGRIRGGLSAEESSHPARAVQRLDRQIAGNDTVKLASLIFVASLVVLLFVLVSPSAAFCGVSAALLTNMALGAIGVSTTAGLLVWMTIGTSLGGIALARLCASESGLLALCAFVLFAYLLGMAYEPTWVAVSPLGPTQNSRFFGVGNQLETLLLLPGIAGAALAGKRFGGYGLGAFVLLSLVTLVDNSFGADGGGSVVLGVGFAILVSRLARLGARGTLGMFGLSGLAIAGLVWYDLQRPGPNHLRSALTHGPEGLLAVVANRVPLAYKPALHQWYLLLPFGLVLLAAAAAAQRGSHSPGRRAGLVSILSAIGASLVVNDSAAFVVVGGIAAVVAVARPPLAFGPLRREVLSVHLDPAALLGGEPIPIAAPAEETNPGP